MALLQRDEMKENAKDDRVDKQSTQQSKLIEQRQDEMGPFDFTKPDIDLNDLLGVPA
jgi:hypothetical protein